MSNLTGWLETFLSNGFDGSDIYLIEDQKPWARPKSMALQQLEDGYVPSREEINDLLNGHPNENVLRAKLESKGHADFAIQAGRWRLRTNMSFQGGHTELRATLRVLRDAVPDLETLGLPTDVLRDLVSRHSGIILVTGITGSGKSTTMASMLMERAKRPEHVITLEDPIEYPLTTIARADGAYRADIQQIEIGVDAASYADALRAALRQDPDVIQIGEINDTETAANAVKAAETGHLVLATLHTRSAHLSVENLIDKFPGDMHTSLRKNLAEYLVAVISQVLVPSESKGRVLAYELLVNNLAIANHIRDGKIEQLPNEIRAGSRYHMTTLNATLMRLEKEKLVEHSVALENTYDRESLADYRA